MSSTPGDPPRLLELDKLTELLARLGLRPHFDRHQVSSPAHLVASLAHGLVGAAERHAVVAEAVLGAGPEENGRLTGNALVGGASELEALGQLQWRITRTTQALQQLDLKGSQGGPDPLGRSILLTCGALSGLLAAATVMREAGRGPQDTQAAARCVRGAIAALDQAAADVRRQRMLADLLQMVD
jgi:hypothetical protein